MFDIELDFNNENNFKNHISGFDLGHMTIKGNKGHASSKSRSPNQASMLVLSLIALMDGLNQLLANPKVSCYEFVAADGSFKVCFEINLQEEISVKVDDKIVHQEKSSEFKKDVKISLLNACGKLLKILPHTDPTHSDLTDARNAFEKI